MKPYSVTAFLALMILYLGVQALTGEKGLLSGEARRHLLEQRSSQLSELSARRTDLESRVRYLQTDNLSRDLLEERARVVLGFSDPRDYVVRVSTMDSATQTALVTPRPS